MTKEEELADLIRQHKEYYDKIEQGATPDGSGGQIFVKIDKLKREMRLETTQEEK